MDSVDLAVHVLSPGFSNSIAGGGGTSFFRGLAAAVSSFAAVKCYEVAWNIPFRWQPDGIEIIRRDTVAAALASLRQQLTPGSVIIKTSNTFGVDDYQADLAIADILGQDRSIRAVYVDGDAPTRLPYMLRHRYYLNELLPVFHGVVLAGGGQRAVAEYQRLTPAPILHLSGCLTALGAADAGPAGFAATRDYDLLVTVGSASRREVLLADRLAELLKRVPARIAVAGDWRHGSLADSVTVLPPRDALDLLAVYARSRFTLNLLRPQMSHYSHTAACRIFEAVLAGSCVISEPYVGLADLLEPGRECLTAPDADELATCIGLLEVQRMAIVRNARQRVDSGQRAEAKQFKNFIERIASARAPVADAGQLARAVTPRHRRDGCVGVLPDLSPTAVQRLRGALHPAVRIAAVRRGQDLRALDCWGIAVAQAAKERVDEVLGNARTSVEAVFVEIRDETRWPSWLSGRDWRI